MEGAVEDFGDAWCSISNDNDKSNPDSIWMRFVFKYLAITNIEKYTYYQETLRRIFAIFGKMRPE